MDAEYRHPAHRAALQRQTHVLRLIGDYGWFAAGWLAAEERQRTWTAEAATARQLRASGARQAGIAASLAATREVVGSALVGAGERLRGGVSPERGPRVAPGA